MSTQSTKVSADRDSQDGSEDGAVPWRYRNAERKWERDTHTLSSERSERNHLCSLKASHMAVIKSSQKPVEPDMSWSEQSDEHKEDDQSDSSAGAKEDEGLTMMTVRSHRFKSSQAGGGIK